MSLPSSPSFLSLLSISLLLGCAQSSWCAENDAPAVKLSDSGICHVRGTSYYGATLRFKAFDTLADCISAGGRMPKTAKHKPPATEGQPALAIAPQIRENPGVAVIRSIQSKYIAIGAMAVIAIGILFAFVRFRARLYPRVHLRRVVQKQGAPPAPNGTGGLSADAQRLLRACLGSTETTERLIQFELERNPALSRGRAAAAAVRRIKRDNK